MRDTVKAVDSGISINLVDEVVKALSMSASDAKDAVDVLSSIRQSIDSQIAQSAKHMAEKMPGFVLVNTIMKPALLSDLNFDRVKTILEDLVAMGRAKEVGNFDPRKYIKLY